MAVQKDLRSCRCSRAMDRQHKNASCTTASQNIIIQWIQHVGLSEKASLYISQSQGTPHLVIPSEVPHPTRHMFHQFTTEQV
eukprot:c29227_g1_i1 orf=147-392(+)